MGHEYPLQVNWNSTWAEIFTAHAVCCSLVLCFIACLVLTRGNSDKQPNYWVWALAIPGSMMAAAIATAPLDPDTARAASPIFSIYKSTFWIAGLFGMCVTYRKLKTENKASSFDFASACFLLATFGFFFVLAPTVVTPREATHRSQCRSNLKQIGIALHNHHDIYDGFPRSAAATVSWRVHALPFLDHVDLYETYNQNELWTADSNAPLANQKIYSLACPSSKVSQDHLGRRYTHYAMVEGAGTFGSAGWSGKAGNIYDGTSNTLAIVEAAGLNIVWTEPRDSKVSRDNLGINLTGSTPTESPALISAWHRGGGNVLLADGSVRYLRHDIDPTVLKALTTVNGGENLPERY